VLMSRHEGADSDSPRWPHAEHFRFRRNTSLEASRPHRMTKGANGNGRRCGQSRLLQYAQHHFGERLSSPSVGIGGGVLLAIPER
jgi:hypothetical protein